MGFVEDEDGDGQTFFKLATKVGSMEGSAVPLPWKLYSRLLKKPQCATPTVCAPEIEPRTENPLHSIAF